MKFSEEAVTKIFEKNLKNTGQVEKLKKELAKKHGLSKIPKNSDILQEANEKQREKLKPLLRKKPTRTISGVSIIAIMTAPLNCPGQCIYCPGGKTKNTPKSYTGEEPAAMRAEKNQYKAGKQVKNRLKQLKDIGHPTEKIELILMGGTLPAHPEYMNKFVKNALDALNQEKSKDIEEAIKKNEVAEHRCIGITFETRPDYCKQKQIDQMLRVGGTRIEMGVQNPDDEIYKRVKRGHTVKDVIEATEQARTSLFKINYHIMPNLPGSNPEKDLKMFKKLFEKKEFKPDMLKIYPTLLTDPEKTGKETELHQEWLNNQWRFYGEEKTIKILAKARKYIPRYVRVMRTQRDIPAKLIKRGVTSSNLRTLVDKKAEGLGIETKEIRYREIRDKKPIQTKLRTKEYETKGTKETFISIEDSVQDKIIGFTRLSFPNHSNRPEINEETAGIRELHVYGPSKTINAGKNEEGEQHKGHGEKLLKKAEEIAIEQGKKKMLIISGIGARGYYRKKGYKLETPYMKKAL
ncbi:MAG: tRNA uridine(34) 5-carboxymethylaminomethyl modification radical SAM/GNAT enzyme Elp3 [archaeon]